MDKMHIAFVRTGGFAAVRLTASVDTQELAADQASHLGKLVEEADFFELPERLEPESRGADRFEYQVTIAAEHKRHSVVVHEAATPQRLKPLLDYLTTLAMVSKKR